MPAPPPTRKHEMLTTSHDQRIAALRNERDRAMLAARAARALGEAEMIRENVIEARCINRIAVRVNRLHTMRRTA